MKLDEIAKLIGPYYQPINIWKVLTSGKDELYLAKVEVDKSCHINVGVIGDN